LWLRQAEDDLRAARLLQGGGQAAQACFQAQQVGEKAIKALLVDKLYAPTRYPDALGDELPSAVFGPEDAAAALEAATSLLNWAREALEVSDED
jgi:HEPN domain-containing protein